MVKGADLFVEASSKIARIMGVSEFAMGLALVAIGTSMPEIAASLFASCHGRGGIVTGTNVANIGLLIGIAALIKPFKTSSEMMEKDSYIAA